MNTTPVNSPIATKFVVIGLPRTGTLSMSQMFTNLGFVCEHPVGPYWESFLGRNNRDVLSDTPMFRPSVIQYILDNSDAVKFVYLNKNPEDWVTSMKRVGLADTHNTYYDNPNKENFSLYNKIDYESLLEVLDGKFTDENAVIKFNEHKKAVTQMIPADRLLSYDFSMGWKPLCEFIGNIEKIPNEDVPHMNKDTMFDKLKDNGR
jgi:hypothetical protein